MLAGKVPALLDGYKLAVETITRGHGLEKLVQFIEATGGHRGTVEAILRDER
jgi:thymidine phosphorylase